MPDLQTELSKIASAWDTHEQEIRQPQQEKTVTQFHATGNATKDTFDFIRLNHNIYTQQTAVGAIASLGYKKSTIRALITQMKRSGYIAVDTGGHLFATANAYAPLRNPYKPMPSRKQGRPKKAVGAGIAALPVAEAPAQRKQLVLKLTAEDVLSKLDVKEAYKLYQELWNMFGGK